MHPICAVSTRLIKKNCLARYIAVRLGIYQHKILLWSAHSCKETMHNIFFALALHKLHSLQCTITCSSAFRCHLPSAHHKGEPVTELPKGCASKDRYEQWRTATQSRNTAQNPATMKVKGGFSPPFLPLTREPTGKYRSTHIYCVFRGSPWESGCNTALMPGPGNLAKCPWPSGAGE